jgi:nucleotide-binding universal stress UspA family protein
MYRRILAAVDGSTTSERALKEALQLAKEQSATLRLAHVIDDTIGYSGIETPQQVANYQAELRGAGEEVLSSAAAVVRAADLEPETSLIAIERSDNRICDEIEREAERWPADLIVIGTHGRRGFHRMLLASVAEGLIRIATKPVLLVRGT